MGGMAISLFVGVSYLAVHVHALPEQLGLGRVRDRPGGLSRRVGRRRSCTTLVQGLTFAILVLAANTSYQGFPRLSAVLARDRYFPRQFVNLGDRLVYSNGIIVLAGIASLLIWAFKADVNALIHLYVIGVFTAFTLSQTGMVRYWLRRENAGMAQVSRSSTRAGAVATYGGGGARDPDEVLRGRLGRDHRNSRCSSPASTGSTATTGRSRAGSAPVSPPWRPRRRRPTRSCSASSPTDSALQRSGLATRSRSPATDFRAIHVPGKGSDTGIRPRFRQLTDMHPDLEIVLRPRTAAPTRPSTISGRFRAASRASSRQSSPSSSGGASYP